MFTGDSIISGIGNMKSTESVFIGSSSTGMTILKDNLISLVVTSPPYPMIEMRDESFSQQNGNIKELLNNNPYKSI